MQEAQTWKEGKSLCDGDYRFLTASQEFVQRETQRLFNLERQEKKATVKAKEIIDAAYKRARRTIRRVGIGFGVVLKM